MQDKKALTGGSVIGILGGGQLGRMTAMAAADLGLKVNVFTPANGEPAPAEQVVNKVFYAEYDDENALKEFADSVDVITLEFENIPQSTLLFIEKLKPLMPNSNAVYITQNRLREKNFLRDNGIPTAKFEHVKNADAVVNAFAGFSAERAIIKTAEFGYDGKGQHKVSRTDNLAEAWVESGFKDAIIEEFIDFDFEISVVLSRSINGEIAYLPIGRNTHKGGILDTSIVPANIPDAMTKEAENIAKNIAELLNYIGTMAVEFFVMKDGKLLVNEIAPRPHNSGHWSMDGCETSQFEQHVRAICGLPLGSTALTAKEVKMLNLIGEEIFQVEEFSKNPLAKLHIYGKKEAKKGRKMGHVNLVTL